MGPGLASVAGDFDPGQALDAAIVEGGRIDDLTAGIDGDVPGPRRKMPIQVAPRESSVLALEQPSELACRVDVVGLRLPCAPPVPAPTRSRGAPPLVTPGL